MCVCVCCSRMLLVLSVNERRWITVAFTSWERRLLVVSIHICRSPNIRHSLYMQSAMSSYICSVRATLHCTGSQACMSCATYVQWWWVEAYGGFKSLCSNRPLNVFNGVGGELNMCPVFWDRSAQIRMLYYYFGWAIWIIFYILGYVILYYDIYYGCGCLFPLSINLWVICRVNCSVC